MIFYNKNNKEQDIEKEVIIITCNCGCEEQLSIKKYEDNDYYISISSGKFYSEQRGIWKTIKNRLKNAWLCLRGKEYRLCDINITDNQLKELLHNIETMLK